MTSITYIKWISGEKYIPKKLIIQKKNGDQQPIKDRGYDSWYEYYERFPKPKRYASETSPRRQPS
jgi:hypothetical protein